MRRSGYATLAGVLVAGLAAPLGAAARLDEINSGPPTVTSADVTFTDPSRTLHEGTAREAGLVQEYVDLIAPSAAAYLEADGPSGDDPSFAGFAVLAARNGVIVEHDAQGYQRRYERWDDESGQAVELPPDEWEPMQPDTIFDMASVTKLFTAVVIAQMAERGEVDLDAPVADYVPEFAASDPDKSEIVVQQLLTHTSGLTSWLALNDLPDDAARMEAIYASELWTTPGTAYRYSDLNLVTLGKLIERVTGDTLDSVIAERITEPLGMTDTMFNPPESLHHRIAATEYMPWTDRGMVRGEVHDENALSLGGVAGHAGIFSTVADMAIFGQMILNGGRYGDARILNEDSVRTILTNLNAGFGSSAARSLGWQLDQRRYMGAMTSPVTTGHTGFAGTSLVVDPLSDTLLVLHTNRVHPTREWGTNSSYRRAPARELARAVPVQPAVGQDAWFSGQENATTAKLTLPLRVPAFGADLTFRLWYDTESGDTGTLMSSTDNGLTWDSVPMNLSVQNHRWRSDGTFSGFEGRQWLDVRATLPPGTTHMRWSYESDADYQGRGIYVDGVRIADRRGLVFNGERPADARRFESDGWTLSGN